MGVGDMISLSISQTIFVNVTLCLFRIVFFLLCGTCALESQP